MLTGYVSTLSVSIRLGSCNHQKANTENTIHIVFICNAWEHQRSVKVAFCKRSINRRHERKDAGEQRGTENMCKIHYSHENEKQKEERIKMFELSAIINMIIQMCLL